MSPESPEITLKRFLELCDTATLILLGNVLSQRIEKEDPHAEELNKIHLALLMEFTKREGGSISPDRKEGSEMLLAIAREHNREDFKLGLKRIKKAVKSLEKLKGFGRKA